MDLHISGIDYRALSTLLRSVRFQNVDSSCELHLKIVTRAMSVGTLALLWAGGAVASPIREEPSEAANDSSPLVTQPELSEVGNSHSNEDSFAQVFEERNSGQIPPESSTSNLQSYEMGDASYMEHPNSGDPEGSQKYAIQPKSSFLGTHYYRDQAIELIQRSSSSDVTSDVTSSTRSDVTSVASLDSSVRSPDPEVRALQSSPVPVQQSHVAEVDRVAVPSSSALSVKTADSVETSNSPWFTTGYDILRTPFSVYTHFAINHYVDTLPSVDAGRATVAPSTISASPVLTPITVAATPADPEPNTPSSESKPQSADQPEPVDQPEPATSADPEPTRSTNQSEGTVLRQGSQVLGKPSIQLQGVFLQEGDDSSARARARATYPVTPNVMFGAEVDLTTGDGFSDSPGTGLDLNELYVAVSPADAPQLRFIVGLMDLTSYFDRNSFAKDATTHFFNRAFQTNPALSAAGIASRPGLLVNWSLTDNVEVKAATFSSRRNLGDFSLDSFAGEIGVRLGNAIIRGTYVTSKDAGKDTGFEEIFQIARGGGDFGLKSDDREEAFGINAEYFIPQLKLGLFGRYGWYNNTDLDRGGNTFSFGLNLLDLFLRSDRLGIAYGRQLSNNDLRRANDDDIPDVLEVFYDIRIARNLRAGVMVQERNGFSETVLGFRVKTEFDLTRRR